MKHLAMLAVVALAGVMEEATDGATGSAGGGPVVTIDPTKLDGDPVESEKQPEGPATEGATSTAPGAVESAAAPAASDPVPTGPQFTPGAVALVTKGIDRLPVPLRDQAHLNELLSIHGAGSVEVQS